MTGAVILDLAGPMPLGASGSAVAKGLDVYLFLTGMMPLSGTAREDGVCRHARSRRAAMDGQLDKSLQNPWLATSVSFMLVLFAAAALFACMPRPLPSVGDIAVMPWWAPLGGIIGAVEVFAGLLLIRKFGAGPVNGVTITPNILASLAIDHVGLLSMEQHSMNWQRALGGALMISGVRLIANF